jgi:membrane protein YqaA with SNARE-associated domain
VIRLLGDCFLWAVLYYKSSPNVLATFFRYKSSVSNLTKYGLGYILGDFFANTFGHPGWLERKSLQRKKTFRMSERKANI